MKEESSNTSIADGISETKFFQLLKDRIFVDYFNVFLTLPVFQQRVLYKWPTDEFEFDPPVKSAIAKIQVEKTRTLNWLYTVRLPLFFRTNLYLEYKLCRKLIASDSRKSPTSNQQSSHIGCDNISDRFEDAVGHVTGMRQFRQYLDRGPGSKLLKLWLDIERFFCIPATDLMTRWMTFREIQITFCDFENCAVDWQPMLGQSPCVLIDGRGFAEIQCFQLIPNPVMSQKEVNAFIADTYSDKKQQQRLDSADCISMSGLRTLQRILLQILRDYWLTKWLLHRQTAEWLQSSSKDKSGEGQDEMELEEGEVEKGERDETDDEAPVEQLKTEIDKMVKAWPAQKRPGQVAAAGNVVDDAFLFSPETNEVITLQDDGSVTLSPIDPSVSSRVIMTPSVQRVAETYLSSKAVGDQTEPRDPTSESNSNTSKASGSSSSETSLSSVSTVSTIFSARVPLPPVSVSTAARKSMTLSGTKERQQDLTAETGHQMRNTVAELRKLTSNCQDMSAYSVRRLSKASPSSTRASETGAVCRKPSQPLLATEPAASRTHGYRSDQQAFLRGIVADRLAGGPFEAYVATQGSDEAQLILNFWRDAQVYLSCKGMGETSVQAYMRCRRAKVLVMRYLTGHSDKRMCVLAPALRYSLQRHLAIGKGDDLMRRAQDAAIEFLRPMWQSYLQSDTVTFQNAVVSVRREMFGFTLKPKSGSTAPNYFQDQEHVESKKSDTEDPVMLERARSYEAARRTELALQYALDMSEFCFDDLLVDDYPESEIRTFPDLYYGSLAVKKFKIVSRPDILLELRRKRLLDQLAWIRKPSMEYDYEDDLESIQSAIRPFMKGSKVIARPERPKSCDTIFEDPVHLEFFQRYLVAVNAGITPLLFYLDVDKMKEITNPVKQKEKVQEILNKHFKTVEDVKKLKCDSRVLETIHYLPKQTTAEMLLIAQSAVRRCLTDRWCEKYMSTFEDEEQAKAEERKNANYERWRKFIKGVNKLRHCLLDEELLQEFESFVVKETAKDMAAGKTYDVTAFVTKETRKVHLEKVINDIRFMRDIELYRILCDQVKRLKRKVQVVKEEEDHMVEEGVRIYDNYLALGVKVNICPEVAISLAQQVEAGAIGRSLFHDAVIEIYPIVDQWWNKFVVSKGHVENFWDKLGALISEKRRKKARKKLSSDSSEIDREGALLRRKGAKTGRQAGASAKQTDVFNIKQTLNFDDDRVHIVFSILNGLRLFLPRALKTELKVTRQLMPGVYQIFYELPSIRTHGLAPDGLYDKLQLRRMQTFMTSRERKTFPVFVIDGTTYVLIHSLETRHQTYGKPIHRAGIV